MNNQKIDDMKQRILEKYERLGVEDTFKFRCDSNVGCFTKCCGDVNIFLTPYDVLRMKNHLKMNSKEFLDKYTISPFTKDQKFPVVLLKMDDANEKRCFFVSEEGCSIYDHRPWPCRMYPVGMAQAQGVDGKSGEEFYFIMAEDVCEGIREGKEWTIKEWVMNQGVEDYNEFGDMYKHLTLHPFFQQGNDLEPAKMDMFYMALYDLDKFKDFLFNSKFFDRFELEPELIARLKISDSEVLRFGFRWLFFALFGEPTIPVKKDVLEKFKEIQEKSK